VAELISAIASLLWPLLVIVVLLVFGRQLLSKLRSSEDVTLEIGGQRLNFKQATDQQSDMITDLQREVAVLKRQLEFGYSPGASFRERPAALPPYEYSDRRADGDWLAPIETPGGVTAEEDADLGSVPQSPAPPQPGQASFPGTSARATPRSILWVDDHPENNAMLAESWRRDGASVEIARTTAEALRLLETRTYGLIISDMVRIETGVEVRDAGMQLLWKVRATDSMTPFVLYGYDVAAFADAARGAGATLVTNSTFELVELATGRGLLDQV
jgi:CheY-like chemotaxis protein